MLFAAVRCLLVALSGQTQRRDNLSVIGVTADKDRFLACELCPLMTVVSTGRRNTLSLREKMECDDGSVVSSRVYCRRENGVVGSLAARGVA